MLYDGAGWDLSVLRPSAERQGFGRGPGLLLPYKSVENPALSPPAFENEMLFW